MSVGTIHLKKYSCFEWIIPKFLSLSQNADISYRSPSFEYLDEKWYLEIYPNGQSLESSVGWISVYFYRESDYLKKGIAIEFTIGLRESDGRTAGDYHEIFTFSRTSNRDGTCQFYKRSELLSDKFDIVPDGYLTIYCLLNLPRKNLRDSSCQTEKSENTSLHKPNRQIESLLCNMKELFLSGKNCDVTMEVKGKQFHAHKIILGAQSPIFSTMFEHNMKENLCGIVSIADAEPDVFSDILLYMYCGEVEKMSSDNALEYYKIAHKYSLQEIKDESLKLMTRSLSISNACDILHLGDVYNETNLKEVAKDFIVKNATSILVSDSWKLFSRENQTLSIEIFEMVITKGASIKN